MASTVSVPSVGSVVCRLSVIVATPGTSTVVFGPALAASVSSGTPATVTLPPVMLEVPVTAPVSASNAQDDVTAVAFRAVPVTRVAATSAMVDDAVVRLARSVITPVVSRPATSMSATVTGELPVVAWATGSMVTAPVAAGPAAAAGPAVAMIAPATNDTDAAALTRPLTLPIIRFPVHNGDQLSCLRGRRCPRFGGKQIPHADRGRRCPQVDLGDELRVPAGLEPVLAMPDDPADGPPRCDVEDADEQRVAEAQADAAPQAHAPLALAAVDRPPQHEGADPEQQVEDDDHPAAAGRPLAHGGRAGQVVGHEHRGRDRVDQRPDQLQPGLQQVVGRLQRGQRAHVRGRPQLAQVEAALHGALAPAGPLPDQAADVGQGLLVDVGVRGVLV